MPRKSKNKKKSKKEVEDVNASSNNSSISSSSTTTTSANAPVVKTSIKKSKQKKILTPEEAERREKQKELQKIIMRLRNKGASKDEIRRAKIQFRHGGSKFATGKHRKRPRDRSAPTSGADWRSEKFGEGRKGKKEEIVS